MNKEFPSQLLIKTILDHQKDRVQGGKSPVNNIRSQVPATHKTKISKRWSDAQVLKYYIFISYHIDKFRDSDAKRLPSRIFKLMAMFIQTRSHDQCRSHHQKTAKMGVSIEQKLKTFKQKKQNFNELVYSNQKILHVQQDENFYLRCDSAFTENQKKQIQQISEEKQSPASTIISSTIRDSKISSTIIDSKNNTNSKILSTNKKLSQNQHSLLKTERNRQNRQVKQNNNRQTQKIQQIIYYYKKWQGLYEELMQKDLQNIGINGEQQQI